MMRWVRCLEFEVYFEGIDEWHQPGEKFLVDGVVVVGIEGGTVGEFHDSSQFVTLGAWRDVRADEGFYEAGDLALQGADFGDDADFCSAVTLGFQRKAKVWMTMGIVYSVRLRMDEH